MSAPSDFEREAAVKAALINYAAICEALAAERGLFDPDIAWLAVGAVAALLRDADPLVLGEVVRAVTAAAMDGDRHWAETTDPDRPDEIAQTLFEELARFYPDTAGQTVGREMRLTVWSGKPAGPGNLTVMPLAVARPGALATSADICQVCWRGVADLREAAVISPGYGSTIAFVCDDPATCQAAVLQDLRTATVSSPRPVD